MQKLGKKFPDHLQKSAWIPMTEFYGHNNHLIIQHKNWPELHQFSEVRVC